jgi:hypothetical protein
MQWSETKKRQARVGDAAGKSALGGAARLELLDHGEGELVTIAGAAIGEPPLGERPHLLVGVEFRRVGREVLEPEPGDATTQFVNRREAMKSEAIPQHDHRAAQMLQQVGEEATDLGQADVVMMPLVVEAEVLPDRADRETGDDRDAVVALPMAQQRRLAAWRPGAEHGGCQHEARFVYEDEVGPQPNRVFFTRGQVLRCQRAIACSSRSRARRSGLWQLHPHWAKSQLTWLR